MNLKELMMNTTLEAVIDELLILYPETDNQIDEYERVYEHIQVMGAKPFDEFEIHIGLVDPSKEEGYEEAIDEDAYVVVSGYDVRQNLQFALGFARWEEWISADIVVDPSIAITNESILAICLYEMTFYGFNQSDIAKELEALESGLSSDMFH